MSATTAAPRTGARSGTGTGTGTGPTVPGEPLPAVPRRTAAAALVWAASLPAAGALSLATAWGGWRMPLVVVGAVVLPFVLLSLVLRLGVPRWLAASVLSGLLVLVGYVLASGAGTTLVGTVGDAVPRLLTEPQPLAFRADLLVVPVLLSGVVGLLVALRSHRPTRVAPVVGAVVLYAAGALLTRGEGDRIGLLAALLLVLAVLGWVLLDETGEPRKRRAVIAGPLLVVAVGVVASASLVPTQEPFDPRSVVDPPMLQTQASSPLPQLAAWSANPDVELFTTSGDVAPLRLVVLDDYDGAQWRAATEYGPLGIEATDVMPLGDQRARFTTAVRVSDLGGSWLPSPGDPTGVTGTDALVDPRTGTLLRPEGTAGVEYEVTAQVDAPDPAALPEAGVPSPDAPDAADLPLDRYLQTPDLPYELGVYAQEVAQGTTKPYQRALAIENAVRGRRTLSERAISGSALWRIQDFLLGTPGTSGAQEGTSEQFATAFALLARHTGLPTRVVVGFRPGDEQGDGTRVVRGEHALAWPEVYFTDLGWVPFDPTPEPGLVGERPTAPPEETQPSEEPVTPPTDPDARPLDDERPGPDEGSGLPPGVWYAAGGALLVGLPLALLLARSVRSWAHRRRGPRGAWAEVLDGLVLAGAPARPAEPAPSVGDRVAMAYGVPEATTLAHAADRSAFAPTGDAGSGGLDGAERAALRAVRRGLRRSLPWWRRPAWAFDPRVFRR
ncbi:MAG: transglutaminaseTgpA domain-containing protein [Nocardioides alkalitolerans]